MFIKEGGKDLEFLFSYSGDFSFITELGRANIIREEDFSEDEFKEITKRAELWRKLQMIQENLDCYKEHRRYVLTEEGKRYYDSLMSLLYPAHKQRQPDCQQ
jgi:hypothetical protein